MTVISISSVEQFDQLIRDTTHVFVDFYAVWCGPCKAIAPLIEANAAKLSVPGKVAFAKVDVDQHRNLAQRYSVTAMPTIISFANGRAAQTIRGTQIAQLTKLFSALSAGDGTAAGSSAAENAVDLAEADWRGAEVPRGYSDVSSTVEMAGMDLLNSDDSPRMLLDSAKPSALAKGKNAAEAKKDWVESSTDQQLMLYAPFNSVIKLHTIQITSLPGSDFLRPKRINLYVNQPHNLDFNEADDLPPTQSITLSPSDWNDNGTASLATRFVKFQKVTSLVLYVVEGDDEDGENESEVTRIDRVRFLGDSGQALKMGKLEKFGKD
ncbi:hypothetical protein TD95_002685 [Thielaviopsis punctulata]|uniref:Thioredoxin domain-containing protein n=1 Tax=Thielaviopsis punctulata TaxID=72032 RepID=A0A0F4ZH38_9PEZI|nr:hypothetical protein TD95_002685 [Thielaviopsis punctulata]